MDIPAPRDYRVDRCQRRVDLTDEDIDKLWKTFRKYQDSGDFLLIETFFNTMICQKRTLCANTMFTMLETKKSGVISFGEYVEIVCTWGTFETINMIKYIFYCLDPAKTGFVDKNEVKFFILDMWGGIKTSNLGYALDYLDELDGGDGRVMYSDIVSIHGKYPFVYSPAFALQQEIMRFTGLSIQFWEDKKKVLIDLNADLKNAEIIRIKKQKEIEAQKEFLKMEVLVKQRMKWKYWVLFWQRGKERNKIAKIAAITAELEADEKKIEEEESLGV